MTEIATIHGLGGGGHLFSLKTLLYCSLILKRKTVPIYRVFVNTQMFINREIQKLFRMTPYSSLVPMTSILNMFKPL